MNIHEYQAKAILARHGIVVPMGKVAISPEQAGRMFDELHLTDGFIKAQIHAGGRGKAGGVVRVRNRVEAEQAARKLIGRTLVTHQTGPRGRLVERVLVQERVDLKAEFYLSVTLDRMRGCPVLIASSRGGVEIEEVAKTDPSAILREYGSPFAGFAPYQGRNIFDRLAGDATPASEDVDSASRLPHSLMQPLTAMVTGLGAAFIAYDCSLIELNPLGLTPDGRLVAADVKMSFDDNALPRHPEIADLRDTAQEDPREVAAERFDLSYVGLEGAIGCMVNGAGLAMATMDLIRLKGGAPANFLDVGGNATVEKVVAAFKIIVQDERVRAILVNIFGGIVRCDLVAEGIVEAVKQADLKVPLVVRLEGNRAAEGRQVLNAAGLTITAAESLEEAATKAVELAQT